MTRVMTRNNCPLPGGSGNWFGKPDEGSGSCGVVAFSRTERHRNLSVHRAPR